MINRRDFIKKSAFTSFLFFSNSLFSFFKNNEMIKGVYVPGWRAINKKSLENFFNLKEKCGINTLMIDVKDDLGKLLYSPKNALAKKIKSQYKSRDNSYGEIDFDYLMKRAKQKNIDLIARHVMFNDAHLYENSKDFRLFLKGSQKWVDVRNKNVLDYNIDLLNEESEKGFKKIVLDYIRFPVTKKFGSDYEKCDVIDSIVKKIKENLNSDIDLGLHTFGYCSFLNNKSRIGQRLKTLEKYADTIYPMIYPSHFSKGFLGFENPERHPYDIITYSCKETLKRVSSKTKIIPMIQAFNYNSSEFLEQVKAVRDCDIPGYVCWNASGNYDVF